VSTDVYARNAPCFAQYTLLITRRDMLQADRPERNDILRTLGHKGTNAKRARYTAYTDPDVLPACDGCLVKMIRDFNNHSNDGLMEPATNCRHCCNWSYTDGPAWRSSRAAAVPRSYPRNVSQGTCERFGIPENRTIGGELTHMPPQEQTFSWLEQGVRVSLEEVSENKWTETQCKEYLKAIGTSGALSDEVIAESRKRKADQLYTPRDVVPAMWTRGYDMHSFIDCPMHRK